MSIYPPPNYTEVIPIFNPINWEVDSSVIDEAFLNANYLKYPVAQGLETLQEIVVQGNATFNDDIDAIGSLNRFGDFNGLANNTYLTIDDNTQTIIGNAISSLSFNSTGTMAFGDLNGAGNATSISTNDGTASISINAGGLTRIGEVATNNGKIVIDPPNQKISLTASAEINLSTFNLIKLGDYANATTYMYMDVANQNIDLYSATGGVAITSPSVIALNASPSGDITIFTAGDIRIGNIGGAGNQNEFKINDTKATLKTTNGFQLLDSNIQYPSTFSATGTTLSATSSYAQTYNGSSLTSTLPIVNSTNVGTQFLITNCNAGSMTVNSSSSQTIYSTITGGATSRTLATGHSQIFTAIRTTSNTTFGWSMV